MKYLFRPRHSIFDVFMFTWVALCASNGYWLSVVLLAIIGIPLSVHLTNKVTKP